MLKSSMIGLLKRLWQHASPDRHKQFALIMILMILTSFIEMIGIGAVVPFLTVLSTPDYIFNHSLAQPIVQLLEVTDPSQLLLPITIIFVIIVLISGVMRIALLWAQTRLGHAMGSDFSVNIFRRTLYQPYITHTLRNSSEVIAVNSTKTNQVVSQAILPAQYIISSVFMIIAILIALITVNSFIAIGAFSGFAAIYGIIVFSTKKRLHENSQIISQESSAVIKTLQEGLGGVKDILIDGTQDEYCEMYRKVDLSLRRAQANNQILGSTPKFGVESLGTIVIVILAYLLVGKENNVAVVIPVIGAFAIGAQRLLPVMQLLYFSLTTIRGSVGSVNDVLNLLDQKIPVEIAKSKTSNIFFNKKIEIKKLSFGYDSNLIFNNLNLTITKGSCVGFIGDTGSGKSTLIDIIVGLIEPTKGVISIDGVDLKKKNYDSWRKGIAYVPQVIFLTDATIAQNIAFGVPDDKINYERLYTAAKDAQISKTIESLEEGYETLVGEQGVRLSGGQRQRIGIARAFYKQSSVIILDEATSALDYKTEQKVMLSIKKLEKKSTILIIAHRLTTLKNCDSVVELLNGRVHRIGTYKEVINNKI
jgi:ATP-binding cassette, subfamily B, bacterial PglK